MGSPPAITGGPLDPHRRPWLAYVVALVYTGNPWADIEGSLVDVGGPLAYVGGPMTYIAGLPVDEGRALAETGGPLACSGGSLADTESSPVDAAMTIWLTIRAPWPIQEAV